MTVIHMKYRQQIALLLTPSFRYRPCRWKLVGDRSTRGCCDSVTRNSSDSILWSRKGSNHCAKNKTVSLLNTQGQTVFSQRQRLTVPLCHRSKILKSFILCFFRRSVGDIRLIWVHIQQFCDRFGWLAPRVCLGESPSRCCSHAAS